MNKVALVTGAPGGIGSEIAKRLDARGYRLILLGRNKEKLEKLVEHYDNATTYAVDHMDTDAVTAFCDDFILSGTQLDVAAVNAGIVVPGHLVDISREDMLAQLQVNLISTAILIQALAKNMVSASKGHIVATGSLGGLVALKGSASYSASKFGLRGLLIALADEVVDKGVKVTGILPAGVDTPMLRHEAANGGSPLNLLNTPVEASDAGDAFERALDKQKLEIYVPYSESITSRLITSFPWLLSRFSPMLEKQGEKGRTKYLERIKDD